MMYFCSAVLLVLGTDLTIASEGRDAVNITLSPAQQALHRAVSAASSKPLTVIILSAVPVDISDLLEDDNVGAVLWAGQPAVAALGIGDILFGQKPPAGRMIQVRTIKNHLFLSLFALNCLPSTKTDDDPDHLPSVVRRPDQHL